MARASFVRRIWFRRKRHKFTLSKAFITESISVLQATVSVAGKSVTVVDVDSTPVVKASIAVTGKSVTELESVAVNKASISVAGKAVTETESTAIAKATISIAGKTVTSIDGEIVPVTKASISVAGKGVAGIDSEVVAKATLSVSGKTVTAIDGEVTSVAKASVLVAGKTVAGVDSEVVAKATIAVSGKTVTPTDIVAGTEWSGFTLRQTLDSTALTSGSNTLVVTVQTLTGTNGQLDAAYLGDVAATGDPYDFAATPVQLQYSGSNTRTLTGAEIFAFDPVTITHTTGRDLLFTASFSGSMVRLQETPAAGYDSATTAWIAAVGSANISTARKTVVDNLIVGLKTDGLWAKLDRLWLFAAENTQSALIDLKALASATPASSPTFTADIGYKFNGTSQYINSGFNPSTAGGVYALNSMHLSAFINTVPNSADPNGGMVACYDGVFSEFNMAGTSIALLNDASLLGGTVVLPRGLLLATRTASNARAVYKNATLDVSDTTASSSVPNLAHFIGARNFFGSADQLSAHEFCSVSIGSGLNSTDQGNLYTRLRTYMTAVGVA